MSKNHHLHRTVSSANKAANRINQTQKYDRGITNIREAKDYKDGLFMAMINPVKALLRGDLEGAGEIALESVQKYPIETILGIGGMLTIASGYFLGPVALTVTGVTSAVTAAGTKYYRDGTQKAAAAAAQNLVPKTTETKQPVVTQPEKPLMTNRAIAEAGGIAPTGEATPLMPTRSKYR